MAELKPCPFCGSVNVYETFEEEHWFGIKKPIVFCNACKVEFSVEACSPFVNIDEDFKWRREKVKEAWNRRADDERSN